MYFASNVMFPIPRFALNYNIPVAWAADMSTVSRWCVVQVVVQKSAELVIASCEQMKSPSASLDDTCRQGQLFSARLKGNPVSSAEETSRLSSQLA